MEHFRKDLSLQVSTKKEMVHSIILCAEAIVTRGFAGGKQIGDVITVYGGQVRGMSDNGYPGWTEYGASSFSSKEEAIELSKHMSYSTWGFEVSPETIRLVEMTCEIESKVKNFQRVETFI